MLFWAYLEIHMIEKCLQRFMPLRTFSIQGPIGLHCGHSGTVVLFAVQLLSYCQSFQ